MKLIIQIPCYNEAATIAQTLADLPRTVDGFSTVEWLVIDDGSTDSTADVARAAGVDHIVTHRVNRGLARAFMTGVRACLDRGADVIVNTDGDNQYCAADIPTLLAPILSHDAEIVIGERPVATTAHFSRTKKLLSSLGSWVVRRVSGTDIRDAPSGFRAMTRDAARQINVFSRYTYTLEMIIEAGHKGIPIRSVPIRTNADLRPSRLVRSIPHYIARSLLTIVRIHMTYRPFEFFVLPGALASLLGVILGLRFMVLLLTGNGDGHVQSLILASILIGSGITLTLVGLIADLISVNRRLLEQLDGRLHRVEQRDTSDRSTPRPVHRPPAAPTPELHVVRRATASAPPEKTGG